MLVSTGASTYCSIANSTGASTTGSTGASTGSIGISTSASITIGVGSYGISVCIFSAMSTSGIYCGASIAGASISIGCSTSIGIGVPSMASVAGSAGISVSRISASTSGGNSFSVYDIRISGFSPVRASQGGISSSVSICGGRSCWLILYYNL